MPGVLDRLKMLPGCSYNSDTDSKWMLLEDCCHVVLVSSSKLLLVFFLYVYWIALILSLCAVIINFACGA